MHCFLVPIEHPRRLTCLNQHLATIGVSSRHKAQSALEVGVSARYVEI